MCSISGFFSLGSSFPEDALELVSSMAKFMRKRGPDGLGVCTSPKHGLAMGHTRLAIIDPSPEGRQPFFSQDKTVSVVFNGEIYNYKQLRAELKLYGRVFTTNTDTEVIVQAYQEWGISCLDRFEGMFGLAIFDSKTKNFFLARDRIGIKPVFFSLKNGFLSFASQAEALKNLPWISDNIFLPAIYHFLTFMACPAPLTTIQGVYKLPAGYILKVDAQKNVCFDQWYCPIKETKKNVLKNKDISLKQAKEQLSTLLEASVNKRMISDAPISFFLSGGLDSSLVTALATRQGQNINTFNVSFQDDESSDERAWARKISKLFSTNHHELVIEQKEIKKLIKSANLACDQPLADCVNVPLFALSKACSGQGFKVVLIGEGADELFFGYPDYQRYSGIENFLTATPAKLIPSWTRSALARFAAKLGKPSLEHILKNWSENKTLFWGGATAFTENEKSALKNRIQTFQPDEVIHKIFPDLDQGLNSSNFISLYSNQVENYFPNADFALRTAFLEIKHRIPELLLARADNMTMAHGLEARVPFLDHEVIEFTLSLPQKLRYKSGQLKPLLKNVARGLLPNDLIDRPKVGFGAPIQKWFQASLVDAFSPAKKTTLSALPSPGKNHLKKWVLNHLASKIL